MQANNLIANNPDLTLLFNTACLITKPKFRIKPFSDKKTAIFNFKDGSSLRFKMNLDNKLIEAEVI